MTKEELENATGQELIEQRDYCGVDGYYGDYLDDVNAEMLKRFNRLTELEVYNEKLLDGDIEKHNKIVKLEAELTELTKDKDYFSDALDKQIEATIKLLNDFNRAKDLIKNIIRVTWNSGWNYSLDWKVEAEKFLKESEE